MVNDALLIARSGKNGRLGILDATIAAQGKLLSPAQFLHVDSGLARNWMNQTPTVLDCRMEGLDVNTLEKIVYLTDIICALTLGLLAPMLIPKEACAKFAQIGVLLGNSPFVIAIAVILGAGASGGTMYVMVRAARDQPMIVLLLVKLFVFALPALATGYVASMALGWLGVYKTPAQFFAFLAVGATLYFCAGIGGIAAMNSTREYKQVLQGWDKDRAAPVAHPPSEAGNRR